MAQYILTVDDETKKKAEQVCNEIGLSLDAAISLYLKKIARENRIPISLNADPFYSAQNHKRLQKAMSNANASINMSEQAVVHTSRRILWHAMAWEDYAHWQMQNKKKRKKMRHLLQNIATDGYAASCHLEALSGAYTGFWSARIDKKNRLVFRITNDTLEIIQAGSAYRDV